MLTLKTSIAQVAAITALVEATAGMIRLMTPWVNLEKEREIVEERERERERETKHIISPVGNPLNPIICGSLH
jgi:hypothetical protein